MINEKSDHQIEVEAKVEELQDQRREWARVQGIEFEELEDESENDVAAPASPPTRPRTR